MSGVTPETVRIAWRLLTNERGRAPDIRSIGRGQRLIYGTVRETDGKRHLYTPFTIDPDKDHVALYPDGQDRCFHYAAGAAAHRCNDIEDRNTDDPHK
jgi:hypothetical protein